MVYIIEVIHEHDSESIPAMITEQMSTILGVTAQAESLV